MQRDTGAASGRTEVALAGHGPESTFPACITIHPAIKRRSFIFLFGFFILLVAAWCAWCARPFYVRPQLVFYSDPPPAGKAMIESWFRSSGHFGCQAFDFGDYLGYLGRPYEEHVDKITVNRLEKENYLLQRNAPRTAVVRFWFNPVEKEWQGPHIIR